MAGEIHPADTLLDTLHTLTPSLALHNERKREGTTVDERKRRLLRIEGDLKPPLSLRIKENRTTPSALPDRWYDPMLLRLMPPQPSSSSSSSKPARSTAHLQGNRSSPERQLTARGNHATGLIRFAGGKGRADFTLKLQLRRDRSCDSGKHWDSDCGPKRFIRSSTY